MERNGMQCPGQSVADSGAESDSLESNCVRHALRLPVTQSVADRTSRPQLDSTQIDSTRPDWRCGAASLPGTSTRRSTTTSVLSSMVHVQVLGGSFGSQPSLLLFCDDKRYLFNVGEGTQRFCISHKIRMVKVQQIFFSRLSFSHLGGYPGR